MTLLTLIADRVDSLQFWDRMATLAGLAIWSWGLIGMDYSTGEMGASLITARFWFFMKRGPLSSCRWVTG